MRPLSLFSLLFLLSFFSGCWATVSELKKEQLLRQELADDVRRLQRKQTKAAQAAAAQAKQERARLAAQLQQIRAENTLLRKKLKKLEKRFLVGQGGIAEMSTTLQALQRNFQNSLGQIENLQRQIKEVLQRRPEQQKFYEELRKRYEALLKNQKALAEQAIPAQLFAKAREEYKQKKYAQALKHFRTFTRRFGSHPLADNAYRYQGEILEKQKKDDEAILAYDDLLKKHPRGSEVPLALNRLGMLHYRKGMCREGRRYFQRLTRYRRHAPKLAEDARLFARRWRRLCKRKRGSSRRRKRRRRR